MDANTFHAPSAEVLNTPLAEMLQKLAEFSEKLEESLERFGAFLKDLSIKLASMELSALQWVVDRLRENAIEGTNKIRELFKKTYNSVDSLSQVFVLRDFLDNKFTPAFKAFDQDVIDGMPTKRHDLKGDAYSAYNGLVGKQVKAASDMVNASTKLSGQLNTVLIAMGVFVNAMVVAVATFIYALIKASAVAVAAPPASTAAAPVVASDGIAATVTAIGVAIGAATTSWATTANAMRTIKEIELVGSNKWPNSNLDYQEG